MTIGIHNALNEHHLAEDTYSGLSSSHLIFLRLQVSHPVRTLGNTPFIFRLEPSPCEPRSLVERLLAPATLEANEDSEDSEPLRSPELGAGLRY